MKELSQDAFKPKIYDADRIRKEYPQLHLDGNEIDDFDPNQLKLLPVLATDRNTRQGRNNELRR